ncbi:MAG TPA: hypothetical protein VD903_16050 [Pseudonocardia sp.]|jgi:DHA1 family tetracycline resistance protein-like MFS transporter|nr:hypothetical protein [Pseudonocardia sp.]
MSTAERAAGGRPVLGNGLYEVAPTAPYLLGAVLLAGLAVFTVVHPGVRQAPAADPVAAVPT